MVPEFTATTVVMERERRKQAKTLVANAAAKLRKAGFKAAEAVDDGDAKTVILDHAKKWHADLIVLGSHGLKGLGRFLMGSVSDAVIRHANCSVFVVRPRGAAKSARARRR
jgi:nucleotide-binding universal stress UspA family protein